MITEALCLKCGETFNPHPEDMSDPDHVEHYTCGGYGWVTGHWRIPR